MINKILRLKNRLTHRYHGIRSLINHGTYDYPSVIFLETSTACNRRCPYCPQSILPTKQEYISQEVIDAFIAALNSINFDGSVDFHFFNEPLLDDVLPYIVKDVQDACPKVKYTLHTNADKLNIHNTKLLIDSGISKFIVSRHAPYSAEWDARVFSIKKSFPRQIKIVKFRPWLNRGGLIKELPETNLMHRTNICEEVKRVHITVNGDIVLCCQDYKKEYIMGNITKSVFRDIWFSPHYTNIRSQVRKGNFELPICKACVA